MSVKRAPDYDDKTDEAAVPPPKASRPAPVLEPNEARQGTTRHNVRYVLAISLAGIVLVYIALYLGFFGGAPDPTP